MRAGLIHSEGGRGPGSGVRATADSISMLLIALLATDSLSETEEHTKLFAGLKSTSKECPLTGKKTFASAVAAILDSEDLARRVIYISAVRVGHPTEPRTGAQAEIHYMDPKEGGSRSRFGSKGGDVTMHKMLTVQASLLLPDWIKGYQA